MGLAPLPLWLGQIGQMILPRHLPAIEVQRGGKTRAVSHHGVVLPLLAAGIESFTLGQLLQIAEGGRI